MLCRWYSSTAVLPPMGVVSPYPDPAVGYSGLTYRYFEDDSGVDYQFGKLVMLSGFVALSVSLIRKVLHHYCEGFGLSYTTFSYGSLSVPSTAVPCDNITATVTVTNTGGRAGDEVV